MVRSPLALLVASAFLICASRASEVEAGFSSSEVPGAKFNKDELEAILKKEHSDRVSNIFDSENGVQRRRLSNKGPDMQQLVRPPTAVKGPAAVPLSLRGEPSPPMHTHRCPHGCAGLSDVRPSLAGTRGTWITRSCAPEWTASAPRKSCRTL